MKVNWFSPLPPAHSAIATYAAVVLPELAQHTDVIAWSEDPESMPVAGVEVRHYRAEAAPWDAINESDVSIYHIGNHPLFHEGIWELSRRQPGVIVLHDARLQEFVVGCAARRGDRQGYLELMRRQYGARGTAAAEDVWDGHVPAAQLVEAFPLTAAFVECALGTVVHSAEALELATPHAAGPLLHSALPYRPITATVAERDWRPPFRLVMFGFLGGERGMGDVLAALAELPERDAFHFDVFGVLPQSDQWLERVHALGLSHHVTIHGYVSPAQLDAALDRAHLAFNLRYPSRGEASFSLLQAWDHGLPVVANRIGSFAEVPATCLAFTEPGRVREDVIHHLRSVLATPDVYRLLGSAGRERLITRHAPKQYAQRLAQFVALALDSRNRCNALYMADRTGVALRQIAGGEADEWALQRMGGAILDLAREQPPR